MKRKDWNRQAGTEGSAHHTLLFRWKEYRSSGSISSSSKSSTARSRSWRLVRGTFMVAVSPGLLVTLTFPSRLSLTASSSSAASPVRHGAEDSSSFRFRPILVSFLLPSVRWWFGSGWGLTLEARERKMKAREKLDADSGLYGLDTQGKAQTGPYLRLGREQGSGSRIRPKTNKV
jgi:hypothetical protein